MIFSLLLSVLYLKDDFKCLSTHFDKIKLVATMPRNLSLIFSIKNIIVLIKSVVC